MRIGEDRRKSLDYAGQEERDSNESLTVCQEIPTGRDGNLRGSLLRKAEDARGDAGKSDAVQIVLNAQGQAVLIAGCQQFVFVVTASVPDGTDGVDDVVSRELVGPGDFCLSGFASAEETTLIDKI